MTTPGHACEGLCPEESCGNGEVWAPCEAEACNEPCRRAGLCECACHSEQIYPEHAAFTMELDRGATHRTLGGWPETEDK